MNADIPSGHHVLPDDTGEANLIVPEDYQSLLAQSGAGTLAGVLRLLSPDGPNGFNMVAEQAPRWPLDVAEQIPEMLMDPYMDWGTDAEPPLQIWGVLETGETLWRLPLDEDPARCLVVIVGRGWQQLNISTTEFLRRWAAGTLDLPTLREGAVPRDWVLTPAGQPVTVPEVPVAVRDPLAQLRTIIGPGLPVPEALDWAAVEADLGCPLPPDYKLLHEAFGTRLAFNGIVLSSPASLRDDHELHARYGSFGRDGLYDGRYASYPAPGGLLLCATTEGRDVLAWDTRAPDPARWPVVNCAFSGAEVFQGTLTELLVADLTSAGLGLARVGPGNPANWAWPFWGPDAPWTDEESSA